MYIHIIVSSIDNNIIKMRIYVIYMMNLYDILYINEYVIEKN